MQRLQTLLCITVALASVHLDTSAQDLSVVHAARDGETARVSDLLDTGQSANTPQPDGATALHWAAHWDDSAMANDLLAAGADVDAANDFGVVPLWLAALNGSASMVHTLLMAGANVNAALPSGETVLMTASRTGDVTAVSLLVSHGANINTREQTRGQTALMWAVAQRHPEIVQVLVEYGADIHIRSTARPRRIHTRTAGFNPLGVIDTTQGGNTALLFAARQGDLESARHLVAAGADVNDTAPMGTSALVVAAVSGHASVAQYLLEQGADPNADDAGYSALHGAILRGDAALALALLGHGADPNAPIRQGSPGRRNSPDYVLQHDVVGTTPFWLAAHFAEPTIMRALAEGGADPEFIADNGSTPLIAATNARRRREPGLTPNPVDDERIVLDAARVAIESGVEINAKDVAGNTALHTAARRQLDSVIRLLAEHGAALDTLNEEGQTPLAVAVERGNDENTTAALLRLLGASTPVQ